MKSYIRNLFSILVLVFCFLSSHQIVLAAGGDSKTKGNQDVITKASEEPDSDSVDKDKPISNVGALLGDADSATTTRVATDGSSTKRNCAIKLVDQSKVPISMQTVRFIQPHADSFYNFQPENGLDAHEFRGPAAIYELEWHCLRLTAKTKPGAKYSLGQDGLYHNNSTEVAKWKTRDPDEAVIILVDDLTPQTVAFSSPPADRFHNFSAGRDVFQSPPGVFHGSPGNYTWTWKDKFLTGKIEAGKWYGLGRDGLYPGNRSPAVAKWQDAPFQYTTVGKCINQWTDYPNECMKHGCEICALTIALSEQGVAIDAIQLWEEHVRPTGEYRQSPAQGGACEAPCLKHAVDSMRDAGYHVSATSTQGSMSLQDLQQHRDNGSSVVFLATCGPGRLSTVSPYNRRNMHALTLVHCTNSEVRYKDTWVGEERVTNDVARVTAAYDAMGRQAVIVSRTEET